MVVLNSFHLKQMVLLPQKKVELKKLKVDRMLLVLVKPTNFGDAYDIDLMLMLKSSRLINAFPKIAYF